MILIIGFSIKANLEGKFGYVMHAVLHFVFLAKTHLIAVVAVPVGHITTLMINDLLNICFRWFHPRLFRHRD